jgi:DNA-binding Lrp family transcriptional regulator
VAAEVGALDGVASAEGITGPYDVIARAGADSFNDLGRFVVSRIQMVNGVRRTLTCPIVEL